VPRQYKQREVRAKPKSIRHMVIQGMSDREIASKLGVTNPWTIAKKRSAILGIRRKSGPKPKISPEALRMMIKWGMTDEQIATRLNMNTTYIGILRRKLGIPRPRELELDRKRIANLIALGYSDKEIATELNGVSSSIAKIRNLEFGIRFPLGMNSRKVIRQVGHLIRRNIATTEKLQRKYGVSKQSARYIIARTRRKMGRPIL